MNYHHKNGTFLTITRYDDRVYDYTSTGNVLSIVFRKNIYAPKVWEYKTINIFFIMRIHI